ncbi:MULTISPECIES: transcriptional regulator [unclassified Cytobacillus]|uniref:transcriptional regulator n=1 Tax=unclassified Cytobacillus TaxID=2675268 RepID=UPI0013589A40|nr:transcriptional regulator [Cytobacillus sp. AMY 15.2]KAF0816054.1 hypothetical protein KIS4809_5150 [Bacillus sp. ZZV12-4809]MCM3092944.1 transcriptional regulator [Cytobacillus sp. AMY 15.2]
METLYIEKDINIYCVTAKSFPNGVLEAHQELHKMIPFSKERRYFGLSRPEKGMILYKAAAEKLEKDGEENKECESFIIKRGNYRTITILDFKTNPHSIGTAFETLISYSDIDPNGYCVEWYFNDKDVKCMVRLKDN